MCLLTNKHNHFCAVYNLTPHKTLVTYVRGGVSVFQILYRVEMLGQALRVQPVGFLRRERGEMAESNEHVPGAFSCCGFQICSSGATNIESMSAKQPGVGFILRLNSNEYFHFKPLFLMLVARRL